MRTITTSTIFATSSTSSTKQGKSIVIRDGRYSLRDLCAHLASGLSQLAERAGLPTAMCGGQRQLNRRWHLGVVPRPATVRVG